MIPLILRLRRESYKEIAKAQDIMVQSLYDVFENAVFHGGTCIWRCYGGNRFSEDIDVYIPRELEKINKFFEILEKKGFIIEKKKIGEQSIFSTLKFNRTLVRFEALFKKIQGHLRDYETAESNFLVVYALNAEELIAEKVETYLKRRKIRDLYDIFFLLKHANDLPKISLHLQNLLANFKEPLDEKELKVLILEGIVPDTSQMLEYIGRIAKYGKK